MTQRTFLVKGRGDKIPSVVDLEAVRYEKEYRTTGTENVGGLIFRKQKDTGKLNKSVLELWTNGYSYSVLATHEGIREKLRRLRPEEAAELDEIEIQMKTLHARKLEVLKRAWVKAHAVTVKELVEHIKEPS